MRATPLHFAALVCFVPLASWIADGGRFAYTMYASTVSYRLEIASFDDAGARHDLAPSDLAANVSSPAAPFLTGAERERTVAQIDALRSHLRDIALTACRREHAARIDITLYERARPSDDLARRHESVVCAK